jgi:hypothetical protein
MYRPALPSRRCDMTVNQERKNDRFRLAHHRLVARALKSNPALLDEAREVVRAWKCESRHPLFVEEWDTLLARPMEQVRREIIRRTPEADRLRASSPFAVIPTKVVHGEAIRRLRRLTSRVVSAP